MFRFDTATLDLMGAIFTSHIRRSAFTRRHRGCRTSGILLTRRESCRSHEVCDAAHAVRGLRLADVPVSSRPLAVAENQPG